MEQYSKKHPAIRHLLDRSPVNDIFLPTPEELCHKGRDLAELFTQTVNKTVSETLAHLANVSFLSYVYAPTIFDQFKDDADRDYYQNNILQTDNPEAYIVYRKDRLSMQNIGKVVRAFYLFETSCPFLKGSDLKQVAEKIIIRFLPYEYGKPDITAINEENYDRMDIGKKIALTKEVAEFAREICIRIIEAE